MKQQLLVSVFKYEIILQVGTMCNQHECKLSPGYVTVLRSVVPFAKEPEHLLLTGGKSVSLE